MTHHKMRRALAILAFLMAATASPLAAQSVKNPAPKNRAPMEQMKTCPDGKIIPADQVCQIITTTAPTQCPPNSVRAYVGPNEQCVSKPTRQCPGKIVVPVAAQCPDSNLPPVRAKNVATPLSPLGNPGYWVPQTAYPRAELRAEIEGTVGFTLNVGPDGKPTQCRITTSSGNDALDWAACENVMQRAAFNPAKDAKGKPVASTYSNRVRWVIPQNTYPAANGQPNSMPSRRADPMDSMLKLMTDNPMAMFEAEIITIVNPDGTIMSCEAKGGVTVDGKLTPITDELRADMCNDPPLPLKEGDGVQGKTRLVTKISFEKETIAD